MSIFVYGGKFEISVTLARSLSVSVSVTVQIRTDFDNFEIIQITKPKSDSWIRVSINRNYF